MATAASLWTATFTIIQSLSTCRQTIDSNSSAFQHDGGGVLSDTQLCGAHTFDANTEIHTIVRQQNGGIIPMAIYAIQRTGWGFQMEDGWPSSIRHRNRTIHALSLHTHFIRLICVVDVVIVVVVHAQNRVLLPNPSHLMTCCPFRSGCAEQFIYIRQRNISISHLCRLSERTDSGESVGCARPTQITASSVCVCV